jgi:hypothetical protein
LERKLEDGLEVVVHIINGKICEGQLVNKKCNDFTCEAAIILVI